MAPGSKADIPVDEYGIFFFFSPGFNYDVKLILQGKAEYQKLQVRSVFSGRFSRCRRRGKSGEIFYAPDAGFCNSINSVK